MQHIKGLLLPDLMIILSSLSPLATEALTRIKATGIDFANQIDKFKTPAGFNS
jgi:hypothetical protein